MAIDRFRNFGREATVHLNLFRCLHKNLPAEGNLPLMSRLLESHVAEMALRIHPNAVLSAAIHRNNMLSAKHS